MKMADLINKWKVVNMLTSLENEFQKFKPFEGFENAMYRKLCEVEIEIGKMPTVDAVEVVLLNALKSLVNGEWVDCKLVQEASGIDFDTGLKMFDFSRTAEWNPAPLNGQKITTKFRLKNYAVHGNWVSYSTTMQECSNCKRHTALHKFKYCPYCGATMGDKLQYAID